MLDVTCHVLSFKDPEPLSSSVKNSHQNVLFSRKWVSLFVLSTGFFVSSLTSPVDPCFGVQDQTTTVVYSATEKHGDESSLVATTS